MSSPVSASPPRVLVVDDEPGIREVLRQALANRGYEVAEAGSCAQARARLADFHPDVAVLDHQLPDGTALDILSDFRRETPRIPVVILTGYGTIDLAVQAIKDGAEQFLTKPVTLPALLVVLERLLEQQRHRRAREARTERETAELAGLFLGQSEAIRRLEHEAQRALASGVPLHLVGETGTGKSTLARWFHVHGSRTDEALVEFHCAAMDHGQLHRELFGSSDEGHGTRSGLIESAHRGTLALSEVGDLDDRSQAALFRVLSEHRFRRAGEARDRWVDVRLISLERRELADLVEAGRFRDDLFYRLGALTLRVPSLRERPEDLPELADHLLNQLARAAGQRALRLGPAAAAALQAYDWPGNLRELRNALERAMLFAAGGEVSPDLLPTPRRPRLVPSGSELPLTLDAMERYQIERAMLEEGGRVERAALRLGIPRSTLYMKLKRFRIPTRRQRVRVVQG